MAKKKKAKKGKGKVSAGMHRMPDGHMMKDSEMRKMMGSGMGGQKMNVAISRGKKMY